MGGAGSFAAFPPHPPFAPLPLGKGSERGACPERTKRQMRGYLSSLRSRRGRQAERGPCQVPRRGDSRSLMLDGPIQSVAQQLTGPTRFYATTTKQMKACAPAQGPSVKQISHDYTRYGGCQAELIRAIRHSITATCPAG